MQKKNKTPVAFKFDTDLLQDIRRFKEDQAVKPSQIGVIETAVREFLERQREVKRSVRR